MKRIKYTGYLAFFVNGMLAVMTGTIMTYLQRDYHISLQTVGLLVSAQSIGNLIMVLLSGFLIHLIGRKNSLLLFPLLFACGFGGIVYTNNTIYLLLLFGLTGLGWGLCNNILNIIFMEDSTGGGISVLYTCYAIGSFMGPFLVVLVRAFDWSWKIAVLIVAVASLLLVIGFAGTNNKEPEPVREKLTTSDFRFFRNRRYYICLILYFGYIGVEVSINSWIITYLSRSGLLEKKAAEVLLSVFWLIVIFGRLFTGAFMKKIRREILLTIQWVGLAGAMTCLMLTRTGIISVIIMAVMAIFMSAISPVNAENADEFIKGKGISGGIMFAIGCTGSTILPYAVGAVANQKGITLGMCVVVLVMYLMILTSLVNLYMKKNTVAPL